MWKLRRGDQRQIAQPRVPVGDDAAPFHRKHAVARGSDFARDLDGRGLRNLLDRAVFAELDEDIVAPLLVDERRAGLAAQPACR